MQHTLGLLRSCLDFAINDTVQLSGIFEVVKTEFAFDGAGELLKKVTLVNGFRNTRIAHQETPLTEASEAKAGLSAWADCLFALWENSRT